MEYKVGQVIYLLEQKSLSITPALVAEEIIRKTIEKETVQYVVSLPDKSKERVLLKDVEAIPFNNIEDLEEFMIENTKKNIAKLIKGAIEKKNICFSENKSLTIDIKDNTKHVQNDIKSVIMNNDSNNTTITTEEET